MQNLTIFYLILLIMSIQVLKSKQKPTKISGFLFGGQ